MNKQLSIKLLILSLLALILAFAVLKVEWKVQERSATRDGAVRSIADQYAREQQLSGPLIWVKCSETRTIVDATDKGFNRRNTVHDCSHAIRPLTLIANGILDVSERYRGIYKARIYLAKLQLQAQLPAYKAQAGQTIDEAYVVFGVSDPRGLKHIQVKNKQGVLMQARPGVPGGPFENGFHVPIDLQTLQAGFALNAELEIAGSGRLEWVPLAQSNDLSLRSTWPHPSFTGQFLPDSRSIDQTGFNARWRINDFATGGDRMLDAKIQTPAGTIPNSWKDTTLGVSLIDPVDAYTQTDRAVRYGFLFVLLSLGGFFLFELLKARPVHPLQYLQVGFAVVLFFLLLLALSEHLRFSLAYLIAAGACVLLISAYGRTLLGSWKGSAILGSGYTLLYFGLYQLLASEDYALLMGAWLIFGLLGLTMYLTRRVDWGKAGKSAPTVAE